MFLYSNVIFDCKTLMSKLRNVQSRTKILTHLHFNYIIFILYTISNFHLFSRENRLITLLMAKRRPIIFPIVEYEYFCLNKFIIIFRSATVVSWILQLILYFVMFYFENRWLNKGKCISLTITDKWKSLRNF